VILLKGKNLLFWLRKSLENLSFSISCFDEKGVYKGLVKILSDLNLIEDVGEAKKLKLQQLREKLLEHPAFNNSNTRLESLASKYGYIVTFCPKYHCELNPIEGVWCFLKGYVRRRNDQNFSKLLGLIIESIDAYKKKDLNVKLWHRFWRALEMYQNDSSYQEVLETLFGAKSSASVISHKKNKDFNTLTGH